MRNEKTWEDTALPKMILKFSPRLQNDFKKIKLKKPLPAPGSYFVFGPVHTGKTVLAMYMTLEMMRQRYLNASSDKILFLKTAEILHNIKTAYDNPEIDGDAYFAELSVAEFLVLDDFGSERPTDWALGILYLLIDRRYEFLLPTIFTSNHSLDEIADKFGDDRITSRIRRMCKTIRKTKSFEED